MLEMVISNIMENVAKTSKVEKVSSCKRSEYVICLVESEEFYFHVTTDSGQGVTCNERYNVICKSF